jgi:hypothetical protein
LNHAQRKNGAEEREGKLKLVQVKKKGKPDKSSDGNMHIETISGG